MVTIIRIRHVKPYTLRGGPLTKLEQRSDSYFKAWQLNNHSKNSSVSLKRHRAHICIISGAIHGIATMSPVQTKPRTGEGRLNNDLQTKLEYFSEEYDKEREMDPRPEPTRDATPPLRIASPRIQEAPRGNGGQSVNLPPLLEAHLERGENGQPLQSSLTSAYGGQAPSNNIRGNLPSNGLVTPFVCWIEDYPLPDGLKMPSYIGSYDGKGDPDNFLHLFEGAIRMQKWLIPVAYHMFTYTLKDSARIWWNSQKAGFVHGLRTRILVEHLSTDPPSTYKGLMEKTYTWVEAREVATNGALGDRRDIFERLKKSSWDNNRGQKNKDRFSPYRGPNHGLLP
ncbi:hypothetical protein Tco_1366907, partial [Tanacetum coccineum]